MMLEIPELIGQERMTDLFNRALESGRIPHALIIAGNPGSGKLAIARAFAMSVINTEDPNHKDIRIIEFPETNPKYSDTIRDEVVNDMQLMPYGSNHKFYIVRKAGIMPAQAQNVLLKSFEEPPEYVHMILLVEDAGKLLPTIRSRAISLFISPVEPSLIVKYLKDKNVPESVANISAALSMGSIKRAIYYSENPDSIQYAEELWEVYTRIALGEKPPLYYYNQLSLFKGDLDKFTELMEIILRDVLVYKLTQNPGDIISPWKDNIKKISAKCSLERLGDLRKTLYSLKSASAMNTGVEGLFDILFAQIGGVA